MKKDKIFHFFVLAVCLVASIVIYRLNGFLRASGWINVFIIYVSILGLGIVFAKLSQFSSGRVQASDFLKQLFEKLERQRIKEAIDLCEKWDSPLSRVLRAGIMKYDHSKDEIREAMDNAIFCERPALEEHLPFLSALIEVLPLIGFLGTFLGLNSVFQAVRIKGAGLVPAGMADLSSGMWQMIIPPIMGLVVLIPLLLASRYLYLKVSCLEEDMKLYSKELLAFLMEGRT